ncbi:MAG TPA: pyrroloquinoline quinone biosynthesis peptide chaperone PqqD [Burkholderiaceae bacterium]|nr:pyrroloquinoline quinone biosynthesis peptide chaperone PqqD [Burkholderiaceae bacterium]HMX10428.1 pyrroloquinoline quinone biosynthesis peptide chaperone PqqD [Burkholderiaceae bacterium]HNB42636.1 pyrroloquinoline quinone biosynthesis peptide chaperone PqqD [Burkholderiaceae bacterium]HNG79429.1 pyrroloquinoline quinone biosynthesis peptide chaperone PqqD [Burkholderiaceae bacterium]
MTAAAATGGAALAEDPAWAAAVPRIGRSFRFQWEPAQNCHVLLYPEGMVRLNQSAGEILKRCDGQQPWSAIVTDLEAAFSASGLAGDVAAFAGMARQQRWIEWS